jgi:hypothetical protein
MRYRKLRIAWSAVWWVASALLVAIWLRSYWRELDFAAPAGAANGIYAEVNAGEIFITFGPTLKNYGWYVSEMTQASGYETDYMFCGFYVSKAVSDFLVQVPMWFTAVVPAVFAAVPLMRWSKRFSLRALLLAATLIAVVLGAIVRVIR